MSELDEERSAWNSVAQAWRKWWHTFESAAQVVNDHLVAQAGVSTGHRVLDIATGIGEPALTAAAATGPDGSVLGCDLSPGMLAVARERATAAGLDHVEFREQAAEDLELAPASFDAAVCRWGLMLMVAPVAAAAHIRAALKPGARFAAAVWGAAEDVPFLATPRRVLAREIELPPLDPEAPGPFRLCDEDRFASVLRDAGFTDVSVEPVDVAFTFKSGASYAEFIDELSSSLRKLLDKQSVERRAELLEAIAAEAESHASEDGSVVFLNRTLCAVARRA